jgi:hypothetical protein
MRVYRVFSLALAAVVILTPAVLSGGPFGHFKSNKKKQTQSQAARTDEWTQSRVAWLRAHGYGASTIARAIKEDPEALEARAERRSGSWETVAGNAGEPEGPLSGAEEDVANRAYPLPSIPADAHEKSRATFEGIESNEGGKDSEHGRHWRLIGPSNTLQPGVLSFTGADKPLSGRVTALAIDRSCSSHRCRLWVAAAGGGVWRNDHALSGDADWKFLSDGFGTNAIGTLTFVPGGEGEDGGTLYAGTGEPNASGDSEAGVGIYRSRDGGEHWTLLPGSPAATNARSVSSIVVDPTDHNIIFVGTTRGVRGISSVTGGSLTGAPGAPPFGLYKSTDGGNTFTLVWDGAGSVRGVNHVELDPSDHNTVYAAAYQQGIWRSSERLDGSTNFQRIFAPGSPGQNTDRTEFALTTKSGHTRIYAGDGAVGATAGPPPGTFSQFWRSDNADVPAAALDGGGTNAGWKNLTSPDRTNPFYATFDYCTGQCWYDNGVFTPKGQPDVVYLYGSFLYAELGGRSNGRAVLLSTTAGDPDPSNNNRTFTDLTNDNTSPTTPNGIHPDQHALVVSPDNPFIMFEGSDGGVVRSDGTFDDVSSQCDTRPIGSASMTACHRLLSRVPHILFSLNAGLSTLQFQSLSVNTHNPLQNLQGGTQDNGTLEYTGSTFWHQIIYGDGGQSGFNVADDNIRFNTFFANYTDANFRGGDPTAWVVISGPLFAEPSAFYKPIIADPVAAGTIFVGERSVWRTKDNGGVRAYLEANCPEFTTDGANPICGDFVKLGSLSLTASARGSRAGGTGAATARATADGSTLWAATSTGRVFISSNADAEPASAVTFTRLDDLPPNGREVTPTSPNRFVSGIYVDPANANHAWISYSGYNAATSATPGHVFDVRFDGTVATWTNLNVEGLNGDLPITALVRDDVTGDLYAATDFGVLRRDAGSGAWSTAGRGLPKVEVPGLTIVPSARVLYAATHGRSAWRLRLPGAREDDDE